MAKTLIPILIVLNCCFDFCYGKSFKTADFADAENVLRMVEVYHNQKGIFPRNWLQIEEVTKIKLVSNKFDYRRKYAFPKNDITTLIQNHKSRIVAMAVNSGGEGDREEINEAGRIILLFRDDNIFTLIRVKETTLSQIFKSASYELADYTGIEGKWANTDELKPTQEDQSKHQDATRPDSLNSRENYQGGGRISQLAEKSGLATQDDKLIRWIMIVSGFCGVGIAVWIMVRLKRTK